MNPSPLCSVCHRASSVGYCECSPSHIYLCSGCSSSHFNERRPHSYRPIGDSSQPAISSREGFNEDCVVCHSNYADFVCCCQHTVVSLCRECVPRHKDKSANGVHALVPVTAKVALNRPGYLAQLMNRARRLDQRKAELRANLNRILTCMEEFRYKSDLLMSQIVTYRDDILKKLSDVKDKLEWMFGKAEREADEFVFDEGYKAKDDLAYMLLSADDSGLQDIFFTYTLRFRPGDFHAALHLDFEAPIETSSGDTFHQVPWFSSNTLKLYDIETQAWEAPWTYAKNFIDQNSSIVLLPGGSLLASGSTEARKEVLKLDPGRREIAPFSPLNVKRMGHGLICWKYVIYAFGGYGLCSCECITVDGDGSPWDSLADMHSSRRFFNPSAHSSVIYLCGGEGNNTVESFDVVSCVFTVLPQLELPEKGNAFSVVDRGRLFIFQKDCIVKWTVGSPDRPEHTQKRLIDSKYPPHRYTFSNVTGVQSDHSVYLALYYKKQLVRIDLTSLTSTAVSLT